jgi:hypothetical protein
MNVGVIGLGGMGGLIARQPLITAGARPTHSVQEVDAETDIVLTALPSILAVELVYQEMAGAAHYRGTESADGRGRYFRAGTSV